MKPNIDYGAELLVELAAKGITQVELAEELGKTNEPLYGHAPILLHRR